MKLVVGLGNPGSQYVRTRHNIGFKVVEALAVAQSMQFSYKEKVHGQLAQKDTVFLLKPETFMNRSGESVRAAFEYFGEGKPTLDQLNHLFVAHDDLDIPLGKFKIQKAKGPKVHNGLLSVYQQLGSDAFWHVRVGVENRGVERFQFPGGKYVLAPFTAQEEDKLHQVLPQLVQELNRMLSIE
jgi:PTH1 family peptidyl-tRNA hydrolase